MGTPAAAVPSLRAMASDTDIAKVITQPDRPRGRSQTPQPSPVKEAAGELRLSVGQPETDAELSAMVDGLGEFDAGVVVAYGRILRASVLQAPRLGWLNVHFSLLPRWRGAAPVERAIMAGDTMTGVTIIELDEGMDTGPVLTAQAVDIGPEETGGALTSRLALVGADLLSRSLSGYIDATSTPITQTDEGATHAAKLTRDDRLIDVQGTVVDALDRIRALAPVPGATVRIDGRPFKVLAARRIEGGPRTGTWFNESGRPIVGLGDGAVELTMLQPPGKNPLGGQDWLRGVRADGGTVG